MENVTADAAYATMGNIVHQAHTIADALAPTAKTSYLTKADAEVAAAQTRANTDLGNVTMTTASNATIRKGK